MHKKRNNNNNTSFEMLSNSLPRQRKKIDDRVPIFASCATQYCGLHVRETKPVYRIIGVYRLLLLQEIKNSGYSYYFVNL